MYSSSPKRTRLDEDDEERADHVDGEGSEDDGGAQSASSDGLLLPDSFRRSPKGKGPATATGKYLPGSIVRVALTNFVTYTKVEFLPGPSLNMIIGPNGTGKSTLVCAICLGLGSKPDVLGRAKKVGEFVKHGYDKAQIEIELAADPERHKSNPVIITKIARDPKGKRDQGNGEKKDGRVYFIDGRKATASAVTALMKSFSVQVDNLCQFLPQDRVVEFAALSPVELLAETQRAAAPPEMSQWHDQLKGMRKQQKTKQTEQQQVVEDLKSKENRQESQRDIVERLRERTQLQERRVLLEKLRPLPEFTRVSKELQEAKQRKRIAKDELAELKRRIQPNMAAETEKKAYLERVKKLAVTREKLVERIEKQASDAAKAVKEKADAVKKIEMDMKAAKGAAQKSRSELPGLQASKAQLEQSMEKAPPEFDFAAFNEQLREKARLIREAEDRLSEIKAEYGSASQYITQQESIIQRAEAEKETLQTQAGQQASKLRQVAPHAYRAWQWVNENQNRFEGQVYGPAIVECMVKDPLHASAVESLIGQNALSAFTTTSQRDYGTLQDALSSMRLDVHIRNNDKPLGYYRPKVPPDALRAYGLDCYVLDLITGPDAVLGMLCDNHAIHRAAYASRQLSNAQLDALKHSDSPITQWVTPSESFTVIRRSEYGPNAVSIRTNAIKAARFFTDAPPNQDEDAELDARVTEARRLIDQYKQQRRALSDEQKELSERMKTLQGEEKALKAEKSAKQRRISEFNATPTRIEGVQKRIDEAQARVNDSAAELMRLIEEIDKLTLEKGQLAINYANLVNSLRDVMVQSLEAKITQAEATSDLHQLEARTTEEKRMVQQKEEEMEQVKKDIQKLIDEGKVLHRQCAAATQGLDDEQMEIAQDFQRRPAMDLVTEIESVAARLQISDGANQRVLGEYEDRANRIEQLRERLAAIDASLEQLETDIANIREQWEPRLDALVSQISDAFTDNFSKIQCAGEVVVHKDENFEQWALHLKVKFR